MSDYWESDRITLSYWLGEICLLRKIFQLQTANVDFINYQPDAHHEQFPSESDPSTSGFMVYSKPMEQGHKNIWRENGYVNYISHSYRQFYIDLSTSYDEYLQHFSSKTRSTFRRKLKKFEKESGGEIDWQVYTSPEEMEEFYKLARSVSKQTYQEKLLNAGLPETDNFLSDMKRNAKRGSVRGYILFLNGKAVSYLYSPIYQNRLIYDYLGYLPEVGRLSAGTVLFLKVLENLFETKPAGYFDFTEGQSTQKQQFSTHNIYCVNQISLKSNFANAFWLRLHLCLNNLSNLINKCLDALGLKTFLKKLLRR